LFWDKEERVSYGAAELVALEHEALLAGHERGERLPLLLVALLAPHGQSRRGGAARHGPGQAAVVVAGGEGGGEERGCGDGRGHCGARELERQQPEAEGVVRGWVGFSGTRPFLASGR